MREDPKKKKCKLTNATSIPQNAFLLCNHFNVFVFDYQLFEVCWRTTGGKRSQPQT